jgi:glyoxylase-like metal-dependent hydrolase (beta-lactamase superfamily II)
VRALKIGLGVLAALLVAAGGAWLWLTAAEAPPERSEFPLDLAEIRRLAGSLPGPAPLRVNSELVAEATLPRAVIFAGASFAPQRMVHHAFQIVFPDRFLVVDTTFDRAMHAQMDGGLPYHDEGWQRVQAALGRADMIFVTHEHGDHLMGAARHEPPEELVGRLRLTREQLANTKRLDEVAMPAVLRDVDPLDYETYLAVAPGVVLIEAPGHTPGNQIVYVRTGAGRELLFIGDVAWHMDAIRNLHYRPRLVTDFFLGEDRRAVLHQFRALHDLARDHPEVQIVVSHDPEQREALLASGSLGARFE